MYHYKLLATALAGLMAGCATLPADRGHGDVAAMLQARGHEIPDADAKPEQLVADLTAKPMAAAQVVRVALLNNPALRAQYAELGIVAAEVYDAGRLSNPTLSGSILFPSGSGSGNETTVGLVKSFTDLLLLPARRRFAEGEFERAKLVVGSAILDLSAEAEAGYYRLVGAQQTARMRETVAKATDATATLAQRFFDAGNLSRLELAREQAAATQARLDRLEAQAAVSAARSELGWLMGLRSRNWTVVEALPMPSQVDDELPELLGIADRSRLDLAASRKRVALSADAVGIARRFRFLGDVEVGVETTRAVDGVRLTGPSLSIGLPIFNQGEGAVARSQAQLQLAEAELQALEVEIANEVYRAHADVEIARARIAQYRTALIPQREEIVQRMQEQVNYMLVGQFELLASKQQEYDAYQGYLEAVRDYWLARTRLTRQVGAPLPSSSAIKGDVLDVDSLVAPRQMPVPKPHHESGKRMDHPSHGKQDQPPETMDHDMKEMKDGDAEAHRPDHEMPSGMESHIPEMKDDTKKQDTKPDAQPHQHGDPQ